LESHNAVMALFGEGLTYQLRELKRAMKAKI